MFWGKLADQEAGNRGDRCVLISSTPKQMNRTEVCMSWLSVGRRKFPAASQIHDGKLQCAEDYDSEEGSTEESGSDSEADDAFKGEKAETDSQASSSDNPPMLRDIEDKKTT